jgi:hypothetical protein
MNIQRHNELVAAMKNIISALQSVHMPEQERSLLQVELYRIARIYKREFPDIELLYNKDLYLLIWLNKGKVFRAVSGPIGERHYALLKDILTIKTYSNETHSIA